MSIGVSAGAVLLFAIALGGCAQSSLQQTLRDGPSARPFDWLDQKAAAAPSPAKPPKARADTSRADKSRAGYADHGEIYFGDGVAVRVSAADEKSRAALVPVSGSDRDTAKGWRKTDSGVSLNFEDAEIQSVARAILGDLLNLNFTIDPGVSGKMSLSTRRPIKREQLITLLESALRSRGAMVVREGALVRITTARDAVGLGTANVGRDAGKAGYGITALPLENISADALSKILDGFGAPPAAVRVDPERNLLIVRGTSVERQQLIDTALAFDVDWMRKQTVGIFPVRNASPDALIGELNKVLPPNLVRTQPIERMNSILAVSKSAEAIRKASDWVVRLDRRSDAGVRVRVYKLKYADARRVASLVRDVFAAGQTQSSLDSASILPGSEKVTARVASAASSSRSEADGRQGAASTASPDTSQSEPGRAAGKIRITADAANNAIVVHSGQQDALLIEQAIRDLDRAPTQVAIEATIAEITLNNSLNNGVQFYLRGKWGAISQSQDHPPLTRVVPGMNLVLGNELSPKLVLDALRSITKVKILSSPSLVVLDNQPAVLQVGDQVPITTRTAQAVTDPLAPIVNSVDFRDTGVILRITPQVHADSLVGIDIEQEISSVKDTDNGTESLTPTISQRRVKSTVSVADGQTLLLAGLISEQRNKGKSGIPGVIDIPVLGNILAGSHNDGITRTELIIFVKPQVVRNMVDARRVAEGLRQRMRGFERW